MTRLSNPQSEACNVYPDVDHRHRNLLFLLLPRMIRDPAGARRARIAAFGYAPLCNLHAERAFRVFGFVLPLCSRCTGIAAGVGCSFLIFKGSELFPLTFQVALASPLVLDGALERVGLFNGTNLLRFMTGLAFGLAVAPLGIRIS